jgi:hypothetical protein
VVDLGNEKFFKPAKDVMNKLQQAGKITNTPFDAPIKWTYYDLWHHQGRTILFTVMVKHNTMRTGLN